MIEYCPTESAAKVNRPSAPVTVEVAVGPDVTSLTFASGKPEVESTTLPETLYVAAAGMDAAGAVSAAAIAGDIPRSNMAKKIPAKLLDMTRPPFKLRMILV